MTFLKAGTYPLGVNIRVINAVILQIKLLYVSLTVTEKLKSMVSSVQFSGSVMSNSLWPHGLQYARLPCLSPTPRACSKSCPLSRWCHRIISSSVAPFFSCPQSFPASGSFPMSQLFTSDGQSIGASALASVLPMNIQGWFSLVIGLSFKKRNKKSC